MPIIYGNMNVDARYAPSFEPNLYKDAWLIPGVTCTDKYQKGAAGGIFVHKYKESDIIQPGQPGRDFNHEAAQDDLIPILLNNNYQKSRKLYGVQINAIKANAAEALMADTAGLTRDSIAASALACLVTESTALTDTTTITDENAKTVLLNARAELAESGASSATTALVSPTVYSHLLASITNGFTPNTNDEVIKNGIIRNYFGFEAIIQCPHMKAGQSYAYYDSTGKLVTVSSDILGSADFVVYNPSVFSVVNNLEVFRLIEGGKDFNGVLGQVEINTGFRVTNPKLAYIHKHA